MRRLRPVTLSLIRPLTIAVITGLGAASAHAGLIISPLGGTTVFSTGDDDTAQVDLNSTYQFYGHSYNSVDVSTNGNLNWTSNSDFANVAFPNSTEGAMIAPMWVDFSLFLNSRIIEQQGNGYFAVTWSSVETFNNPGSRDTFQALVFDKDENFGGFNFQAGDIAFAYGTLGPQLSFSGTATVGLNNSNGTESTGLPTTGQSLLTSSDLSKLDPVKTEFILMRWNGTNYNVSYQHTDAVVPEPASMAAIGIGLAALAARKRRKR